MDRFHALILSGDMSIPDFNLLLEEVNFEPKDRYLGESVIEKIYGSVQKAYDEFETKYYEAENEWIQDVAEEAEDVKRIQKHKPVIGHERKATQNVLKTIEFVESVAKDPTAFLADQGRKLEKPNNVIEMSDLSHEDREELITGPSKRIDVPKPKHKDSLSEKYSRPGHPETMVR